jgi:hypothetical protein
VVAVVLILILIVIPDTGAGAQLGADHPLFLLEFVRDGDDLVDLAIITPAGIPGEGAVKDLLHGCLIRLLARLARLDQTTPTVW